MIYANYAAIDDAIMELEDEDPATWPVACYGRCARRGGCDCEVESDGTCEHECQSIMRAGGYA